MTWLGVQLLMSKFLLNSGHDNMQHLMSILLLRIDHPAMSPESSQEQARVVRITPGHQGKIVHHLQNIKEAPRTVLPSVFLAMQSFITSYQYNGQYYMQGGV